MIANDLWQIISDSLVVRSFTIMNLELEAADVSLDNQSTVHNKRDFSISPPATLSHLRVH